MGASGSVTTKASIKHDILTFTKWDMEEVSAMFHRCQKQLSEIFALRKREFDFLLGGHLKPDDDPEKLDWKTLKKLYHDMFEIFQTRKGICDKFEVTCGVILLTNISSEDKLKFFFDLFNFNAKGYLTASEMKLLIISVTNGANKLESSLKRPTLAVIDGFVKLSLNEFAIMDPGRSIRKPEFISFAQGTREILAYMDFWRGHASQVMTGGNRHWEDPLFLAEHSSIVPSRDWMMAGLPPRNFIFWRRLPDVNSRGNDDENISTADNDSMKPPQGCTILFTHTKVYFREVTKNPVYAGTGCAARGYLKQGFLADRYIMNALAVCIARPEILTNIFGVTEQEHLGRYNVRLFEGSGWRSVFVDDRVPCLDDTSPAFMHSSDPSEAWPLLISKAFAKYFGSYGHLALSSSRFDSPLAVLRMLTGGHVIRKCTSELQWTSGKSTVISLDGYRTIRILLEEGSLVAFGRSEVRSLDRTVVIPEKEDSDDDCMRSLPPLGRLYPVVGIIEPDTTSSYVRLILRDAWDSIAHEETNNSNNNSNNIATAISNKSAKNSSSKSADSTNTNSFGGPDTNSGHFRTFRVRLEDIPWTFDYMVLCRFPDTLRTEPSMKKKKKQNKAPPRAMREKEDVEPWRTLIKFMMTDGPASPARFRLVVPGDVMGSIPAVTKAVSELASSNEVIVSADKSAGKNADEGQITTDQIEEKSETKVHDEKLEANGGHNRAESKDKSKQKEQPQSKGAKDPAVTVNTGPEQETETEKETIYDKSDRMPGEDEMAVDIALTVSSAFDWLVGGDDTAGAETRVRIVPSGKTLAAMRKRRAYVKERERVLREKRAAVKRMLEAGPEELDAAPGKQQGQGVQEQRRIELENALQGQETTKLIPQSANQPSGVAEVIPAKPPGDAKNSGSSSVEHSVHIASGASSSHPEAKIPINEQPAVSSQNTAVIDSDNNAFDDDEPVPIFDEREVYTYASAGSWLSLDNLRLLPGEYFIYADVSFLAPVDDLQRGVKRGPESDFLDSPWKADAEYCVPAVWVQVSTSTSPPSSSSLSSTSVDASSEITLEKMTESVDALEAYLKIPLDEPQPVLQSRADAVVGADDNDVGMAEHSDSKTNENKQSEETKGIADEGKEVAEGKDEGATVLPVAPATPPAESPVDIKLPLDLEDVEVGPATWPLMAETQKEAASRGLYERLVTLRTESEQLAAEFLSAAKRAKDAKKKLRPKETLRALGTN